MGRFYPNPTAVSLLDRLLCHVNTVVTDGESYRVGQKLGTEQEPRSTNPRSTEP